MSFIPAIRHWLKHQKLNRLRSQLKDLKFDNAIIQAKLDIVEERKKQAQLRKRLENEGIDEE